MWTFARYRAWLEKRPHFNILSREAEAEPDEPVASVKIPPIPAGAKTSHGIRPPAPSPAPAAAKPADPHRIEIEPLESFDKILKGPAS